MKTSFGKKIFTMLLALISVFNFSSPAISLMAENLEGVISNVHVENRVPAGNVESNSIAFEWAVTNPKAGDTIEMTILPNQGIILADRNAINVENENGTVVGTCNVASQKVTCVFDAASEDFTEIRGVTRFGVTTDFPNASSATTVAINYLDGTLAETFDVTYYPVGTISGNLQKIGGYVSGREDKIAYTVRANVNREPINNVIIEDVIYNAGVTYDVELSGNTVISGVTIYERYMNADFSLELDGTGAAIYNRNVTNAFDIELVNGILTATKKDASTTVDYSYIMNYTVTLADPTNTEVREYTNTVRYAGEIATKTVRNKYYLHSESITKERGTLTVVKLEKGTATRLEGATFELTNVVTNVSYRAVSDVNGEAYFEGLTPGDYNLVELSAPNGYIADPTVYPITIVAGVHERIEIENEKATPVGSIIIYKVDANDTSITLAGAVFEVRDSANNLITTVTTNADGVTRIDGLTEGVYTLTETVAPTGYILNPTPIQVTVVGGEVVSQIITNTKTNVVSTDEGTLKIIKYDKLKLTKLAGAQFDIIDRNTGLVVGSVTTDSKGEATIVLPVGNYNVVETVAPNGFELDQTPISVTIRKNTVTTIKVANKKLVENNGKLKVIKTDPSCIKRLAGAVFNVVDRNTGSVVATATTDAKGEINLTLPVGQYQLVETAAPNGYELDSTPRNFNITRNFVTTIKFINKQIVANNGKLKVIKTDTGCIKRLAGAVFDVIDRNTGAVVATATTDAKGEINLTLPVGQYRLVETAAPNGYELDSTPRNFNITRNFITTIKFINKKIETGTGTLVIKKGCFDLLRNETFTIYDSAGNYVTKVTIKACILSGKIKLPVGTYRVVNDRTGKGGNVTIKKNFISYIIF
jgi:Predicted outer membrane protein